MLTKSQKKYLFAILTQKLIEEAYIIKEPYREIRLTQKGIREANKLFTPSVILQNFLTSTVGVSAEKAREASVVIASELDEETLEKLVAYSLSLAK